MKTRLFAWLCLAAGLGLVASTLRRNHRDDFPTCSTAIQFSAEDAAHSHSVERTNHFGRTGNDVSRVAEVACSLAREGKAEEAWRYCDSLSPGILAECAPLVASIQATIDPLKAWEKVSSLGDEKLRTVCQKIVLRSASDGNLQELAGFATTLSDAEDRETLLCEISSRWALQDPAALSQWPALREMPVAVRDTVASRLVYHGDALNRSPEVAGAWAESITDPDSRAAAIETTAREWSAINREAAREFVRRSTRLDATSKDSILTSLEEGTPPP